MPNNKLKHIDLAHLVSELTDNDFSGICYGFSSLYLLALLANDEQTVIGRLRYINKRINEKNGIDKLINDILSLRNKMEKQAKAFMAKAKKDEHFTYIFEKNEKILFDIDVFCQNIAMQLNPYIYENIFNGFSPQSINTLWISEPTCIRHKEETERLDNPDNQADVENSDVDNPTYHTYSLMVANNKLNLIKYFIDLRNEFKRLNENINGFISSDNHAITITFDKTHGWRIIDSNKLYDSQNYSKQCHDEISLVNELYSAFQNNDICIANLQFVTTDENTKLAKAINIINQRYPISENINLKNNNQITPLRLAAQNGHTSLVKELLNAGANVNGVDNNNGSLVKGAKNIGKKINGSGKINTSPLYMAVQNGHADIVKILLENNANVNVLSKNNITPLHLVAHFGNVEITQLLMEYGANINALATFNSTPLYAAAQNGHTQIVDILLKKGANANQATCFGATPLTVAAECGHTQIVELLIEHGANVNHINDEGQNALSIASDCEHNDIIRVLKANGATHPKPCHPLIHTIFSSNAKRKSVIEGAVLGAVIGGAIGAGIGLLTGGPGVLLSAAIGTVIGAAIGGAAGFFSANKNANKTKEQVSNDWASPIPSLFS